MDSETQEDTPDFVTKALNPFGKMTKFLLNTEIN